GEGVQPAVRWVFSDVTPQSFRWRALASKDGWNTSEVQQEMIVKRIDARDRLPEVLPASSAAAGFENETRLFGQFAGDWTIKHEGFLRDGSIAETDGALHLAWVLDGRAVQDVWRFKNPAT